MAKADNKDLKEKLKKIIDDARNKQAEKNEDGSKKYNSYEILSSIDINDFVSQKSSGKTQLSYLSWADALHIVRHLYPNFTYKIIDFDTFIEDKNGNLHPAKLPYLYDPVLGYLAQVEVTIENRSEICLLPIYDNSFKAKKSTTWSYRVKKWNDDTKFDEKFVSVADMGDINYAHQRCLVKCLGLHGLGDYLYRGESLPSGTAESEVELLPQYVKDEVGALRDKINNIMLKIQYDTPEDRSKKIYSKKYKDALALKATDRLKQQFESGGCNIEYTKHLINMAMALDIDVGQFIKTTPEVK